MENLEQIVANNLTELRKEQKWTQAELAEKINYSDKSVSKWERGDALPDLKVLLQMAELFGVSLDYFVTENAAREKQKYSVSGSERIFRVVVDLLAVSVVWLIATLVFIFTAYQSSGVWMAFVWAVPVSAFLLSAFSNHWKHRVRTIVFNSVFTWTLLTAVYLQMLLYMSINIWQLYLVGIPAQAAIIPWGLIRHTRT